MRLHLPDVDPLEDGAAPREVVAGVLRRAEVEASQLEEVKGFRSERGSHGRGGRVVSAVGRRRAVVRSVKPVRSV